MQNLITRQKSTKLIAREYPIKTREFSARKCQVKIKLYCTLIANTNIHGPKGILSTTKNHKAHRLLSSVNKHLHMTYIAM